MFDLERFEPDEVIFGLGSISIFHCKTLVKWDRNRCYSLTSQWCYFGLAMGEVGVHHRRKAFSLHKLSKNGFGIFIFL